MFNETSCGGLGALPVDYVFAGAEIYANANVSVSRAHWDANIGRLDGLIASHYQILRKQHVWQPGMANVHYILKVRGDMGSISHIEQTFLGAMSSVGFDVKGVNVRFISNPRRDGAEQPPVGTPGADPRYTQLPKAAGNIDTYHERTDKGIFGNALEFYLGDLAKKLNMSAESTALLIGAGVLAAVLILKR